MFGLMTKKAHREIVERHMMRKAEVHAERAALQERLHKANIELMDLRAFKAKVMKGLNAANAKRKAERESA